MAALTTNRRVQRHRSALRQAALRPIQIWVPDTRRPGFDEEYRRQAQLITASDKDDAGLNAFMDAAAEAFLADLDARKA